MKDGVIVTQSTDITTVTYTSTTAVFSSSYTISNVSISDNETLYTCTATNPIGSDNYNFAINIRELLYACTYVLATYVCIAVCVCMYVANQERNLVLILKLFLK